MTENSSMNVDRPEEKPLESWKEIAVYLGRDVSTVRRWEKDEALPVRRHLHQARSSVYAYPSELEAWKAARQPGFDQAPLAMPWRRPIPALGFALTLLLALISVASGPILTPPGALAQESGGMVARQVWTGPGANSLAMPTADGRFFTYLDNSTGDLAIRDMETGESRHLTNKGGWSKSSSYALLSTVSPDGQQVAYAWFDEKERPELRLIGIAGGESRLLHRSDDVIYLEPHAWTLDGNEVLVEFWMADQSTQIAFVGVADGTVRVLKTTDWRHPIRLGLSRGGRFILYDFPPQEDSGNRDIYLLASDGSFDVPLVEHPANDYLPLWTPDGEGIVFSSDRTGSPALWSLRVADGRPIGSPKLVKRDMGMFFPLRVTQSGSLYYTVRTGMRDIYFTRFDSDTGKRLAEPVKPALKYEGSNGSPRWSPDGKFLAYFSRRSLSGFQPTVVVREVESGDEREFSPPLFRTDRMTWSRDGRSLLLSGNDRRRRRGFFKLDLESGAVAPLLRAPAIQEHTVVGTLGYRPILTADGETLYLVVYERTAAGLVRGCIVARDLPTGSDREIYCTAAPGNRIFGLTLSPDEAVLAFSSMTGQAPGRSMTINLLTVETREVRPLLEVPVFAAPLAWSPDGESLYFRRDSRRVDVESEEHTHQLWLISVDGGEPQKLSLGIGDTRVHGISLHPDGRQAAFAAGENTGSEIWVLENFLPKPEAQAARMED